MLKPEKKIYSVSELNRETKYLLSDHFSTIQVEGEMSNLSSPASGHIYFSLKDKKAQVRCAMFKSQLQRLQFKPTNGEQVVVSAQVGLYEARGDYQLIADRMKQAGEGDLQLAFDRLKAKLLNEGLFDIDIKVKTPKVPVQIAIVTSPSGAAIHDILTVLNRRLPSVPVVVYPTAVQGDAAKFEIVKAIEAANQKKQADLIILARGGGSLEDLWAFNEECVARAIVKSNIAIISAIGHEVDFTIADFVADLRAPTPSVAAEYAVPDQQVWLNQFQAFETQLHVHIKRKLAQSQQSIVWLQKRLKQQHIRQQLQRHAQGLDHLTLRLEQVMQAKIRQSQLLIDAQNNALHSHNPLNIILRYKEQQYYLNSRLNNAITGKIDRLKNKYLARVQTLHAISPLAILGRGYAIVSQTTSATGVNSVQQLSVNQTIKTRLADGEIISQIKDIQHD